MPEEESTCETSLGTEVAIQEEMLLLSTSSVSEKDKRKPRRREASFRLCYDDTSS